LQVPLAGYYVSIDHRVHLYASYQRHLYQVQRGTGLSGVSR